MTVTLEEAQRAFAGKAKPLGALGRLEEVGARLAVIQGTLRPSVRRRRLLLFAGDHGVVAEGVSAYPQEVTARMLAPLLQGGAAAAVLAQAVGAGLEVIDVGVAAEVAETLPGLVRAKVRPGTRNFCQGPAMTTAECAEEQRCGAAAVGRALAAGVELLAVGEIGIGNTTSAAALLAGLGFGTPEVLVGLGSGVDALGLSRKVDAVNRALALHRPAARQPDDWLCRVGGLELAAMAGALAECHARRVAVIVDGFVVTAAAAAVLANDSGAARSMFFAHRSAEQAHRRILEVLGVEPLLHLEMRLGEGTGALLAIPLLDAAARLLGEMATLASLNVLHPAAE